MDSRVLSLRIDADLLERIGRHAARRGVTVQDYVVHTLSRDDYDQRFQNAVDATEAFYGTTSP